MISLHRPAWGDERQCKQTLDYTLYDQIILLMEFSMINDGWNGARERNDKIELEASRRTLRALGERKEKKMKNEHLMRVELQLLSKWLKVVDVCLWSALHVNMEFLILFIFSELSNYWLSVADPSSIGRYRKMTSFVVEFSHSLHRRTTHNRRPGSSNRPESSHKSSIVKFTTRPTS